MADLKFVLYDLAENEVAVGRLLSYELCRETDAPCDGLRLYFINGNILPELYRVKAYIGKRCVFNGYVDTQRETSTAKMLFTTHRVSVGTVFILGTADLSAWDFLSSATNCANMHLICTFAMMTTTIFASCFTARLCRLSLWNILNF